jgi:hypothetical protein
MTIRPTTIAFALALAGLTLAQEPRGRAEDQSSRPAAPRGYGQIDASVHKAMQGIWKIEKIDWETEHFQGQDLAGFMLIDEGHLAFEVHARAYDDRNAEILAFQSGISRYQFSPVGELETISMVGSDNFGNFYDLEAVPPGEVRRSRVRLAGDVMLIDRPDSHISLRRVPSPKPPFHDRLPKEGEAKPGEQGAADQE